VAVPVVARLVGTNAAEGRAILEGTEVVQAATMTDAAKKVVALAGGVTHGSAGEPAAGAEATGTAIGAATGIANGDAPGTTTGPGLGGSEARS
jgi:hypothetical protein